MRRPLAFTLLLVRAAVVCLLGLSGSAAAVEPAVLDAAAVPNLSATARASYGNFLLTNLPRAFALTQDGHFGWSGGSGTIDDARAKALKLCADNGGVGCALYAEDLRVVWPGRPSSILTAAPGPLIQTAGYAFVPDARFIWHGPATATGLFIWGHGKNNLKDSRGQQPQAYVRAFNNAGFDVVRFDREPSHDYADEAADGLRSGLEALRRMGWRKIVAGGQSRGAWASLQVLDTPGLADAVIAISPAYFGDGNDQTARLYALTHDIKSPGTRVAIAHFAGDAYVTDMDRRVGSYRETMPSRVGAFLLIDRPAAITGHGGGNTAVFAQGYADCLLHFVMDTVPRTTCPGP